MRLATTLGTNALLQRAGVPTALFITEGFGDLLLIGTQQRPDLFALDVRRPEPLYDGGGRGAGAARRRRQRPASPSTPARSTRGPRELLDAGIRVAAVALMHAYRNPRPRAGAERAAPAPGASSTSPAPPSWPRGSSCCRGPQTAVVDAYLAPVVRTYLDRVRVAACPSADLLVMTSAGGLLDPDGYRPKDSLLSGPAGGVVGGGAGRAAGRLRADHRLRHGRHQHRRGPLRRRLRVPLRAPGRRRRAGRPGAGHRDGRRRRRLDLLARRRAAARRSAQRRRAARAGLLRRRAVR